MGSPKTRRSFDAEQHHRHQRFEDEYQFHEAARQGLIREESSGPAGLVFLCNSATMRDCFHFRVLGLPVAQIEIVERVIPRTKLFLFNVETKELYGVFEAASRGGLDLVPEAFQDSKGAYAAQVCVFSPDTVAFFHSLFHHCLSHLDVTHPISHKCSLLKICGKKFKSSVPTVSMIGCT
jgi:hypothetical protein